MKQLFFSLLIGISSLLMNGQIPEENRDLIFDLADLQIIEKAYVLLADATEWIKQDERECEDDIAQGKYSLYCALYKASLDIKGEYEHRKAAMQQVRFTLEKYDNGRVVNHRLMDWNNHPDTTFEDIKKVLWEAKEEVRSQLEQADKDAVKHLIERFLVDIGNYNLDALPAMFSEHANIGGASYRNGEWNTFTMTFTDFLESLKQRSLTNPSKYTEPVTEFTIHIDGGMLAFVKADAILIKNGVTLSNNFDYFTLIKEQGEWKILSGSYVSIPLKN